MLKPQGEKGLYKEYGVKFLSYCMSVGVMQTVTDCMIAYDKSHLLVTSAVRKPQGRYRLPDNLNASYYFR